MMVQQVGIQKKVQVQISSDGSKKEFNVFFLLFWYSTARLVSMNILADETAFGMHLSKYLFTQCS